MIRAASPMTRWGSVCRPAALLVVAASLLAAAPDGAHALGQRRFVGFEPAPGAAILARGGALAPLLVDPDDHPGVLRAARDLQADIHRVTGLTPDLVTAGPVEAADVVVIGSLGRSALIDRLVREGKLDVSAIEGRWEAFLVEVVAAPMPGVERAVVIAGSDKRGAIYGIYELSKQIGVSPWYWWADVPVRPRSALFVQAGRYVEDGPAVKYRGIFLNDEAPALTGWVLENFGTYDHRFYGRVFELLLRLRGNYLWPAMWNNAFNEDDPLNPKLADEYGVVMGTSHHEPMLRAHQEWRRHGRGRWDYASNQEELREFWTQGVRRNRDYESIVTVGMRGDGDEPMSEEANIALLERIVADQRAILAEHVDPDVRRIPQIWALYKEVQEYYEKGMRVPDDVTLLWSDDNWGQLRRLPTEDERRRPGGAGIYYHLDYVGGPRSYKWINTTPISKIWEQMHLGWRYGADRIWIVNVGDLKPMEFPIEFFLHLAWAPDDWPHERLGAYGRLWAEREFGPEHATEIAELVAGYTRLNGRRKPELLAPDTYSLVSYREAEQVLAEFHGLVERAEKVHAALPPEAGDAFFQLVLHPVKAAALVNDLHVTVGLNRLYAVQGRAATNALAERARELFRADGELTRRYDEDLADGKWRHFMDQTHIGYTYWQQPVRNALPAVTELQVPEAAQLGVAAEGTTAAWPTDNPNQPSPSLPAFDVFGDQTRTLDVFNRGRTPFTFTALADVPWLRVSPQRGEVKDQVRVSVSVDWSAAPPGRTSASVTVEGTSGDRVAVEVPVFNPKEPQPHAMEAFVETDGHVSIEAAHYHRSVETEGIRWQTIADYGRTLSGVTPFPVDAATRTMASGSPRLEYDLYLFSTGDVDVELHVSPTNAFVPGRTLRAAVSFDDAAPQVVEVHANPSHPDWQEAVRNAIRKVTTAHAIAGPGLHVLKIWMVDPGVVLQKIVVDTGGVRPSYLGPPETFRGRGLSRPTGVAR